MNFPKGAGQQFQPARFEERGTAVAFTTPALSQARIRKDDRDNLELTVSAFSGVKGNYVIRWKDVPEIFSLTMHDRALQEAILKHGSCLPPDVRRATLETAKTGLAGPESQRSAQEALAEEEEELLLTRFFLFRQALEKMAAGAMTMKMAEFTAPGSRERIKSALGEIAQRFGTSANELYNRLERWGEVLAPLGLGGMPKECRLRRMVTGMSELADNIGAWAETDKSEAAGLARAISRIAYFSAEFARDLIAAALRPADYPDRVLANWEKALPNIQKDVERLWWTVDGWEFIVLLWRDAEDRDRDAQREAVTEIYRILPIIPEKEAANRPNAQGMQENSRMQVRALEGWNTGALDSEMVRRVESVKRRRV
ncbi:MAG TPA: hypothetical protein VKZ87_12785 [Ferrovibrio sp.]|uniref:hypothetical protein n=1 Tax=Ferrovibrio sp. TaxID=1917215 RepID=UPI002B4B1FD3|nr:hypothetical protein [Ferrovibrio sp.]HLT78255.1 hypothetical protein [Ferrovibrio sp.]